MNNTLPKRIVIWGLRQKAHTSRYVNKAFYETALKLGYKAIWVEDTKENGRLIESGDLIIAADVVGRMVPEKHTLADYHLPIRNDVQYCLHNFKELFTSQLDPRRYINLKVYQREADTADQKWGPATYFNTKTRSLYQPWGTDLLPEEFKPPVYNTNRLVFWIGSVWNNALNQGNLGAIEELTSALKTHDLHFFKLRFIPNWLNVFFIRHSRIAPAIAGQYQVSINYPPCRMFKNISYGQLGISNVKKFKEILGDSYIEGETISELVDNALSLSKTEYLAKIKAQQEIVKNFTYKNSIENIIKALNIVSL